MREMSGERFADMECADRTELSIRAFSAGARSGDRLSARALRAVASMVAVEMSDLRTYELVVM